MRKTTLFRVIIVAASVALMSLIACEPPGPAALSAGDKAAIEAADQAWQEAVRSGDWAGAAALYAENAVFMPPNEPAVEGRGNIQVWFEALPPVTAVEIKTAEIDGLGDLAFTRGTYSMTMSPEGMSSITDSGKYVGIFRKQADGSWLYSRDIFNSNLQVK
jgi:uncharacterized protein (TIGR02246 family)